jgi:integrase
MAVTPNHPSIGPFRKIRLHGRANAGGYYEIRWTDPDRGSCRESTKTKVLAQAEDYLKQFCADAEAQNAAVAAGQAPPVPTIDELCRLWLIHVTPLGKDTTGRYVLQGPRRLLGRYNADQLDGRLLQDYARQRGLKSSTIRREIGGLRTVLIWAAKNKLIPRDDIPVFDDTTVPPEGPARTKFLDPGQEQWFWDQAMAWGDYSRWNTPVEAESAYRVKLFIALGLETAARRGAIVDLDWDRVDLTLGLIDYRNPNRRIVKIKRRVQVPISDRLLPVLKEAWLRAPKDPSGRAAGPVIGTVKIGTPFAKFAKTIGMAWVTPHVLRHTWASLAAMNGVGMLTIARILGDSVVMVEAHYAHLTPGHLRDAINHKSGAMVPGQQRVAL